MDILSHKYLINPRKKTRSPNLFTKVNKCYNRDGCFLLTLCDEGAKKFFKVSSVAEKLVIFSCNNLNR